MPVFDAPRDAVLLLKERVSDAQRIATMQARARVCVRACVVCHRAGSVVVRRGSLEWEGLEH